MKNLQFNPYQRGAGWGGSKKSKLIPAPPRPAPWCGAKISPHPCPTTFTGRGKPVKAKWGKASQAGRGKIAIPIWDTFTWLNL